MRPSSVARQGAAVAPAREVLFVVGETSGDLHAAGVVAALRELRPDLSLVGVGGDRMQRAGLILLEHSARLSAMGFVEVLRHIPQHWRLLQSLRARFATGRVALVVLLDYPGFNLRVAAAARAAGVPVLYYITPQVWAWNRRRLSTMARVITKAAVILPFEVPLLQGAGIDTTFVGHPLLDHAEALPSRAEARVRLGMAGDAPVLALFPGSRAGEIARHLDVMVDAARRLEAKIPGLRVIVAGAPGMTVDPARCPYPVVREQSFTVFRAADTALCKSGTNTLEAAVAGCPLVVGYRTSALTYAIAKRVVTIPHVSLVNIVAQRAVARELLQDAMTAEGMAEAAAPLLQMGSRARDDQLAALATVRASLGSGGAAGRVAAMAAAMVPSVGGTA